MADPGMTEIRHAEQFGAAALSAMIGAPRPFLVYETFIGGTAK
jgi:hypothetical protein